MNEIPWELQSRHWRHPAVRIPQCAAKVVVYHVFRVDPPLTDVRDNSLFLRHTKVNKEPGCGKLCHAIGLVYKNQQRWAEAVPWLERAVAAFTFTHGAENEQYTKTAERYVEMAKEGARQ